MRIGKVSENVLKRSVLKQIQNKRSEVLFGADVGGDCAILTLAEDEDYVMTIDPVSFPGGDIGILTVHNVANDLAAAGAEPVGIMISALLPEKIEEAQIKEMVRQAETACKSLNMQLIGGHTEVTGAVVRPVLTAAGIGKVKKGRQVNAKGARPGQDIIASKWIGLEGTALLAQAGREKLAKRYSAFLIEEAEGFRKYHSVLQEAATAVKSGVSAMHDVTEGGIFGALWEIAESSGVGLEVELKRIPVKQETIEICEFFELNPYELLSGGCLLMVADRGYDLVRELEKQGIAASVIGKITDGNDRVVINEEERRFLEPPKADEIHKVLV